MAKAVTTLSVNCFPVFLFHLFLFREVENYDHFEILIRCIFRFDIPHARHYNPRFVYFLPTF